MHPLGSSTYASVSLTSLNSNTPEKSQSQMSDKLIHTSNSCNKFSRTLSVYGIDDNSKTLKDVSPPESPTVFAHRKMEGDYNLETGLYISDPRSGDGYGDFNFYQGRGTKKYQTNLVARLEFDEHSLKKLQETYREVKGPTAFLSELLAIRPGRDLDLYLKNPDLFSYLSPESQNTNGFLISPNLPYIETPSHLSAPSEMKYTKEGIALCAYAIYPNQDLSLINIFNKEMMNSLAHPPLKDTRTAVEIEFGSPVKYLSSILDLSDDDIPMLTRLSEHLLEHLSEVYQVNPLEDKVQLFFHFPVAEDTATLHLHARVNKADHPLNEARSFALSEVINALSNGSNIIDMILARNDGIYHVGADEPVAKIKHIPHAGTVNNPHALSLKQPFETYRS